MTDWTATLNALRDDGATPGSYLRRTQEVTAGAAGRCVVTTCPVGGAIVPGDAVIYCDIVTLEGTKEAGSDSAMHVWCAHQAGVEGVSSDPGYRPGVDWTVMTVCPYCHATVASAGYTAHDIINHQGLERVRDSHRDVCEFGAAMRGGDMRCFCSLDRYEAAAATIAANHVLGLPSDG